MRNNWFPRFLFDSAYSFVLILMMILMIAMHVKMVQTIEMNKRLMNYIIKYDIYSRDVVLDQVKKP